MGLTFVELILAIEDAFAISIADGEVEEMTTPARMIAHIQEAVGSTAAPAGCLAQRAFHRVRAGLVEAAGVKRSAVTLETRISSMFSGPERDARWDAFRIQAALPLLPGLRAGRGWLRWPLTGKDLVAAAVGQIIHELKTARAWTNAEVRQIVRHTISAHLGIKNFPDSAEFVRDLGAD